MAFSSVHVSPHISVEPHISTPHISEPHISEPIAPHVTAPMPSVPEPHLAPVHSGVPWYFWIWHPNAQPAQDCSTTTKPCDPYVQDVSHAHPALFATGVMVSFIIILGVIFNRS